MGRGVGSISRSVDKTLHRPDSGGYIPTALSSFEKFIFLFTTSIPYYQSWNAYTEEGS